MKLFTLSSLLSTVLFILPLVASAATPRNFAEVVAFVLGYINIFVVLLFGATFIVFIWGIVKAWVIGGGNAESVEHGQQIALWGVIGLVVMASVWGIVTLLRNSLGL